MIEVILERTVNDKLIQCGYVKSGQEMLPVVVTDNVVTPFDDITKARSAFWDRVNDEFGVMRPSPSK